MTTFDDIEVRRPELATSYLALLAAQPGRPLALFAPRRVGKTYFLDHDLAPAASRAKMLPVYADLWLNKAAPLEAINHVLEEALDDAKIPTGAVSRLASTPIKKIGALGASIDLGEAPQRRPLPDNPALRLDVLVTRVAEQCGGKILLMLDEAQTLGDQLPNSEAVIASLRAVLHNRRQQVDAVFTGSSQEGLAKLMNTVGAPMYQFAQLLNFPVLGDEYLNQLAEHFAHVHSKKSLRVYDLHKLFAKVGYKPALMRDIVKVMSAEGITDTDLGLQRFMLDERQASGWRALLQSLDLFDQSVLIIIAQGLPPMGRDTLERLATIPGVQPTISKVRTSIEKLKRQGILAKAGNTIAVEDPLFAEYLDAAVKDGKIG